MQNSKYFIKEIINFLYTREIVGKALFFELENYPELFQKCLELEKKAFEFEYSILNKKYKTYNQQKNDIITLIKHIDNIAAKIEKYRKSMIYWNENLEFVDLF